MKTIDKIRVLNKFEVFARMSFLFKKKTNFFKRKILAASSDVSPKKVDLFNAGDCAFSEKVTFNYANQTIDINSFHYIENDLFWFQIDAKEFVGDIREYWEFNRLQFLNPILSNYLSTNDEKYVSFIDSFLKKWFKYNPLEKGWNHISNLEIAIRSIVLYRIWFYLGNKLSIDLSKILFVYGLHLFYDLPRTNACVPNNHSLGEAASLFLLGTVFEQKKWTKLAKKTILKRFDLFTEQGEGKEESSGYLLFATQMLVFLSSITNEFDDQLNLFLPRIFNVLRSLSDKDGGIAQFGDCDCGLFYCFNDLKRNSIDSLSLSSFANYSNLEKLFNSLVSFEPVDKRKYYIDLSSKRIRVGMIGGFEINHGHNQSLSYIVWIDGKQVVLNPGTYRYNGISIEKRLYYAGSSRQNSPLSSQRDNLVTSFRHKKVIKYVELNKTNNKIVGRMTIGNVTLERTILLEGNSIVVHDKSSKALETHHIILTNNILVKNMQNVKIDNALDWFSPLYGYETKTNYVIIQPNGFESIYSLLF